MKFTKHSRTIYSLVGDGYEAELNFEPVYEGDIMTEWVGDKLVVAYLVHDDDAQNPMEISDCNGEFIIAHKRGYYRDMSAIAAELCVDSDNDMPDVDKLFSCEPYIAHDELQYRSTNLRTIATNQFIEKKAEDKEAFIAEWYSLNGGDEEHYNRWTSIVEPGDDLPTWEEVVGNLHNNDDDYFWRFIEVEAAALYSTYWRQLVGPYVVPMTHYEHNGTISVDNWNGDYEDLPNGLWVACKCAIENIEASALPAGRKIRWEGVVGAEGSTLHAVLSHDGVDVFDSGCERGGWGRALVYAREHGGAPTEADLRAKAEEYAEATAREYSSWAEGDVYGCVVQVFEKKDGFQLVEVGDHDSCWGFIGHEYARETLENDYFKPSVKHYKVEA